MTGGRLRVNGGSTRNKDRVVVVRLAIRESRFFGKMEEGL